MVVRRFLKKSRRGGEVLEAIEERRFVKRSRRGGGEEVLEG